MVQIVRINVCVHSFLSHSKSCSWSWARCQIFLCLEPHTNEATGSIQCRIDPFASFAWHAADNCDKSYCTCLNSVKSSSLHIFLYYIDFYLLKWSISTPPGWDAGPLQGYYQNLICWYPFTHLGEERHWRGKVSCPRTQHCISERAQTQTTWSGVKPTWGHHPSHLN